MNNVKWEPVNVSPNRALKGKAYARITPSSIAFNGIAASMIDNIEKYPWATVQVGTVEGKPAMLGFRFIEEPVPDAFAVKRQSKSHKGVTFFSRELVRQYFKINGLGSIAIQQSVEKLGDTLLAVKLPTEESVKEYLDEFKNKSSFFLPETGQTTY